MQLRQAGPDVCVSGFGPINLGLTLDCGQAFRWEEENMPEGKGFWSGVGQNKSAGIIQKADDLIFLDSSIEDVKNVWAAYFDFATDYDKILNLFMEDEHLKEAVLRYGCIRILRQEPWETICSFIISACNNIPRIKGIIKRLCENFGRPLKNGHYSFPGPADLASLTEDDLHVIRAGYRTKAILDAARKFESGELDIKELETMEYELLKERLMTIYGVGQKIADCSILFGFGRHEVYPIDRHIQRITEKLYPNGLPECVKGYEGIAQQYLFCLARGL